MASQRTNTTHSSIISTGYNREDDDDDDDGDDHLLHNLSRLSICTGNNVLLKQSSEEEPPRTGGHGGDQDMGLYMSRLSTMEDSDGDADEELSDDKEDGNKGLVLTMSVLSSDSDKEAGCLSLPSTPPRLRRHQQRRQGLFLNQSLGVKDYASENEAHNKDENKMRRNWRRRSALSRAERWFETSSNNWDKKKNKKMISSSVNDDGHESTGGNSCIIITRPKGGQRALYMDLGEVKACEDLGFELEHERMLEFPIASSNNNRVVVSMSAAASTIDTASSGGNSPIANLRISSPGDDPRDVKARIKMWAQAVASSASPRRGFFQ